MRKKICLVLTLAAAAAALFSCARVQEETPAERIVQFTAGAPETRTVFIAPEGDSYPVRWTSGDTEVRISLNMLETRRAVVEPSADGKSAAFSASFESAYEAPYYFDFLSPSSAYVRDDGGKWEILLPDEQKPLLLSVDPKAQILVAQAGPFAQMPGSVAFSPKHWTAYGILTFENLSVGTAAVSRIEVTAEKPLAGRWTYDTHDGTSAPDDAAVNTVKIQSGVTENVWFACAPVDLSGTKVTFKVVSEMGDFVKEVTLPAGRNLTSGKVARIKVDMSGITPHTPALKVERVWGKFSTADASWNEYYGGTPDSDRNVALDDDYIYIAETNKTRNLWAISRTDPSEVKKLPVGTVKEAGTFYVSCPRIIKNSDASINGGKDVLAVCSMTWGDPVMYYYSAGIDADPTVQEMPTWASRRLGDTFTVWGTLQNGVMFFKDYEDESAVMTFLLQGRVAGSNALQGRFVMADGTGVGAYYPFPENIKAGVYAAREARKAWWSSTEKDPFTATGGNACTLEQFGSGYYLNVPSIQYIEFCGKRYVAYTRQVSGSDGRLIIIEGKETDDWKTIINTRKVVYQAAIQENAEMKDEYKESPKSSGNSGFDLAVREIDGALYIAAVKQNVGLSLFKMSFE